MRNVALLGIGLWMSLRLACAPACADPPPGKGYVQVFADEFVGDTLNTALWSYNYPWGTTHNGQANMRPSQVTVSNGVLTLTAVAERSIWDPWGFWDNNANKYVPFDYTSGTVHTKGKASWRYGYFEGRFKMPAPVSTWPAFWMLQDGWPPELDIFEVEGDRRRTHYSYHYRNGSGQHAAFGGEYWGPNLSADWHTYGVEWTPDHLDFYFDGRRVNSFTRPSEIAQMQSMYLLIDLQVGGWAPDPKPADYPAWLQCDWVRVWQIGGPPTGTYRVVPALAPDKSLEVRGYETGNGAPIDQWTATFGDNQRWTLDRQSDGSYKIRANIGSNKVLDLSGWQTDNGTKIVIWDDSGGDNQRWYFQDVGGGFYRIIPRIAPGGCLDVRDGSTEDGAEVWLWGYWGGANQLWQLSTPDGQE